MGFLQILKTPQIQFRRLGNKTLFGIRLVKNVIRFIAYRGGSNAVIAVSAIREKTGIPTLLGITAETYFKIFYAMESFIAKFASIRGINVERVLHIGRVPGIGNIL
ncbi:MAG: hypothetical protein Q8Q97_01160 [bacterium]|nr:hypothetical protein [bacterium]